MEILQAEESLLGEADDGETQSPSIGNAPVIGVRYTSEFKVIYLLQKLDAGEYSVSEAKNGGDTKFKILPYKTAVHRKLKQLDENGRQIAMVKEKNMTVHARCEGYRCDGEDKSKRKKVFSICKPCVWGNRMDLRVTLEDSSSEGVGFKIIVNSRNKTCSIYNGSAVIAQTHLLENGAKYMVDVYPNVDCAFVFLLIATVDAMGSPRRLKAVPGRALQFAGFVGCNVLFDQLFEGLF